MPYSFGNLMNLTFIDLSDNQLIHLSWKILLPSRYRRNLETTKLMTVSEKYASLLKRGFQIYLENNPLDKKDCETQWALSHIPKVVDRGWQNEVINTTVLPSQEELLGCSLRHQSSRCYLCPPQLHNLYQIKDIIVINCSVEGVPEPLVFWETTEDIKATVTSSINKHSVTSQLRFSSRYFQSYKYPRLRKKLLERQHFIQYSPPFAWCRTHNPRGFAYKDLCEADHMNITHMKSNNRISAGKIVVRISGISLLPDIRWTYSPCVKSIRFGLTLTFTQEILLSHGSLEGKLHYTKADGGGLHPGWYQVEASTPCKKVISRVLHYDSAPHQRSEEECPFKHAFQGINVEVFSSNRELSLEQTTIEQTTTTSLNTTTLDEEQSSPSVLVLILIVIFILLFLIAWIIVIFALRHWWKNRLRFSRSNCSYESPFKIVFQDKGSCTKYTDSRHQMHILCPDRLVENPEYLSGIEFETTASRVPLRVIPMAEVTIGVELGEGAFGRVYLGSMEEQETKTQIKVAIKTLKSNGPAALQDIRREVEMMSNLEHEHIVKFYGVSYDEETMLMIFEYMEEGDLNYFLRYHNEEAYMTTGKSSPGDPLTVMQYLQIALQIASGMAYLASKHYVHRDLATRNCLVGAKMVVKIADFGMSRDVYTDDYYQFGGRSLLPVRWMPPESILYRRFTIQSDIWSFGIVLWEIFTGGKQPWYGYSNQEVITQITAGKMMPCPDQCPSDMYTLMISCWAKQPNERMPMESLHKRIRALTTLQPNLID